MIKKPIRKELEHMVDEKYQLKNLINMENLKIVFDDFHKRDPFPVAVIDLKGEVLLESYWEPICTQFHRAHPKTAAICTESDIHFNTALAKGNERHILYTCGNGLYDAASPIIIEEQHVGNFFIGQFLLEPPDQKFFRKQAQQYGFEEEKYLEALSKISIISERDLKNRLDYLCGFAEFLGNIGLREFELDRAEAALRGSEEKYRTILESMEEGYYEVDLAGNFTYLNDAMCKIRGFSREELMEMNSRESMTEETAKEVFKAFSDVYTTGKSAKNIEWETIRKDGTIRIVETSASLIKDAEGEPKGFRGVVRDISEKRRLETQLQYARKMESIGTLAGGIAHNFNNLLMGIMGYASLMLSETSPDHPNHKRLRNIEKQAKSGSRLTSQLLGYAREGSYDVKPINLNQLVKETSDTFGMTKKEITVHQELSEKLNGIKADQGQIEQVLLNLYVNASEAMPGGGDLFLKTINIADKNITGKPYKAKPGDYVMLTIEDTGVGMDKKTRERIFDPFFTTKGLAIGAGLGMASAYGIIKAHNGYIDADSKIGQGTTFNIYLPAIEKPVKEKQMLSDGLFKGKGTVLLVDDEEIVLESGQEMLEYLGYVVLLAGNGKQAVELYKKNRDRIDMILLDMVMPVMGGGEAFDRIKEINTNVKVLLSSGYSLEGEAKEILKRGCDAFIQKPFNLREFSQKIREILAEK
jgi:two-component system, cell cycle sensor histidine kinase and response regulator CckA